MRYAGFLVVEDASGVQLRLYEYRGRFFWKRRFVLETGEVVTRTDFNTYKIAKTGEALVRVQATCPHEALTERNPTNPVTVDG